VPLATVPLVDVATGAGDAMTGDAPGDDGVGVGVEIKLGWATEAAELVF
jgi:hypothetical protein